MKTLAIIYIAAIVAGVGAIAYMSHEITVMANAKDTTETVQPLPVSDLSVTQSTDTWGSTHIPLQGTASPQVSTQKQGN